VLRILCGEVRQLRLALLVCCLVLCVMLHTVLDCVCACMVESCVCSHVVLTFGLLACVRHTSSSGFASDVKYASALRVMMNSH
jgi:hypothetical protein